MSNTDQPDDPEESYQFNISRRRLLQGTGAAAGTAVGVGAMNTYAVEEADALAPLIAIGAGAIAGAAITYVAGEVIDYVTGPDVGEGAYSELTAEELHTQIRADGIEMKATDNTVATTIENQLNNAQNIAYSNAKKEAILQFELGNTEQDAIDAAKQAVTSHYVTIQSNVVEHFGLQNAKINRMFDALNNDATLSPSNVFTFTGDGGGNRGTYFWGDDVNKKTANIGLLDSSTYSIGYLHNEGTYDYGNSEFGQNRIDNPRIQDNDTYSYSNLVVKPVDGGSKEMVQDAWRWNDIWESIKTQDSTVKSEIETFVTNVKPEYDAGNIDTTDLVSAADISQDAADNEGFAYAAADLANLGIAGSNQAMRIELHGAGLTVTGTLYLPNADTTLNVGERYNASDFTLIYLAYEYTADQIEGAESDGSDFIELEQEFTVLEAKNIDGSSTDTLTFSETNQQTTVTDAATVNDQLDQLAATRLRIQEQQKAAAFGDDGGGGDDALGFSFGGGGSNVVLLGGAAVAAYLLGK